MLIDCWYHRPSRALIATAFLAILSALIAPKLAAQTALGEHEHEDRELLAPAIPLEQDPSAAAQSTFESRRDFVVRVVYLIPSNREPQPDAEKLIQRFMLRVQRLYGENLAWLGYPFKTFALESQAGHDPFLVHIVRVADPDTAFHNTDYVSRWVRILDGVARAGFTPFMRGQVLLVIAETHRMLSNGTIREDTNFVGGTGAADGSSGVAVVTGDFLARTPEALLTDDRPYGGLTIPALGPFPLVQNVSFPGFEGSSVSSTSSSAQGAVAHELAHAFALPHDFRNDRNFNGNLLGNGFRGFRGFFHPDRYPQDDVRLSSGSALQLNFSRFFNENQLDSIAPFAQILSSGVIEPVAGHLRIRVRIVDDTELAAVVLLRNGNAVADLTISGPIVETSIDSYDFTPGAAEQWQLIVFDAAGNRGVSAPVVLTAAHGVNRAVVPDVSISRRRVGVGEEVLLDARRAFDPDGPASGVLVEWDLDGDGDFDTPPSTDRMQAISFSQPGVYQVRARFTDAAGDTSVSMPIGVRVDPALVNHLVTLEPTTRGTFTSDASGCPAGYAGKLFLETALTNLGLHQLFQPAIEVALITAGNFLLGDDGRLLEEQQVFEVLWPHGSTPTLLPGEAWSVPFTVCLETKAAFRLYVNVRGTVLY
jgi:hypothetical protein